MKTLSVICPSRGRPHIIKDMLQSFYETTSGEHTKLLVYLNEDDTSLPEYEKVLASFDSPFLDVVIGPRKFIVEVYNMGACLDVCDYYAPINDDHVFITPDWDRKLIDVVETKGSGWGVACADDLLTDWSKCTHPSGCVISGNIARTLSYLIHPAIRHIGTDTYLMKMANGIKRLFMERDIVIEHRHWINGQRPMDANYRWVYSNEEQEWGRTAIRHYLFNAYRADMEKLYKAMEADGVIV